MIKRTGPKWRHLAVAIAAPLAALLSIAAWSLASPVGSSPDDDFHLASIWCGQGEREGLCEAAASSDSRVLAEEVTSSADCYATKPAQSAECQEYYTGTDPSVSTDRGNFTGAYPPLFYFVMSTFASPNIEASAVTMRIVNGVIFVGLTVLLYWLLPVARRRTLIWGWLISIVPLGMFLIASNNPSSWAVISAGTLWIALVGYFESSGHVKVGLGIVASVAAALGAGARSDSALYAVIAVLLAVVLTVRKDRRYLLSALLPVALSIMAIIFYLTANQGGVAAGGFGPGRGTNADPIGLLSDNLINMPLLWAGSFGSYGLGWLDTPMPGFVSVGGLMCFAAVAFLGLSHGSWRKGFSVTVLAATLWLLPSYVLYKSNALVGAEVQPRYLLPLIIMLGGIAILGSSNYRLHFSRPQLFVLATVPVVGNSLALHANIRRYVTGVDVGGWNLDGQVEWWWDVPFSPMLVWVLGSAAFAVLVVTMVTAVSGRSFAQDEPSLNQLQPR